MAYTDVLLDTCSIERNASLGNDPDNNPIAKWSVTQTLVACRLLIKMVRELDDAAAQQAVITEYTMLIAAGVDINEGDRISTVVHDNAPLTEFFDVEGVAKQPRLDKIHHIKLTLKRIN